MHSHFRVTPTKVELELGCDNNKTTKKNNLQKWIPWYIINLSFGMSILRLFKEGGGQSKQLNNN